MKRSMRWFLGILVTMVVALNGCKKNDGDNTSPYPVPDTYNFSDADSLPAKSLLSMLAQMETKINKGNIPGNVVSSADLKSMYANTGSLFGDTVFNGTTLHLNTSGLSLKASTFPAAQALVEDIFDSIELASTSTLPASDGVAGVSSRQTLLSRNGVYWRQFFTKIMMGVVIGHLITDVYLGDSLNNNLSIAARQHAWDQAFFLWGVPSNFPANRKNVKYWGSYTSQIDSGVVKPATSLTGINANPTLMGAFLKGRAALANDDAATAMQQAAIIIPFFETMEAAAAVHEINESKNNLANSAAAVAGSNSESLGFWTALKYNQHKKISDSDYQAVLSLYGSNLWDIDVAGLEAIKDKISGIYGWGGIKGNL